MRADAQANRDAIVESAKELFADVGIEVSMRTVASEAGVGIGTLYRHFPTKDDLLRGVADHVYVLVDGVAVACEREWETSPEAAWSGFVHQVAALRLGRLLSQVTDRTDLILGEGWGQEVRERAMTRLGRVLDLAHAAGLVRQDIDALHFQVGVIELSRPLGDGVDQLVPGWQEWLVEVYLRGLRP